MFAVMLVMCTVALYCVIGYVGLSFYEGWRQASGKNVYFEGNTLPPLLIAVSIWPLFLVVKLIRERFKLCIEIIYAVPTATVCL